MRWSISRSNGGGGEGDNTTEPKANTSTRASSASTFIGNTGDALVFQNEIFDTDKHPVTQNTYVLSESEPYTHTHPPTPTPSATALTRSGYEHVTAFFRDTRDDLKAIRWRHLGSRISSHFFPLLAIGGLIYVIFTFSLPRARWGSACTPDGEFRIDPILMSNWSPWTQTSVLAIDLAFGNMDFATAKGVDIVWDLVFGRCVQGLLGVISYKTCTKALSRVMEETSVTLRTFEAVTLQSDSLVPLWKLTREIINQGGLRAKLVIVWILLSTMTLLSFQSLTSAMTGYTANVGAFIQLDTGARVPANSFEALQYIIHDGSRLGESFTDELHITIPSPDDPSVRIYEMLDYTVTRANGSAYSAYSMLNNCNYLRPLRELPTGEQILWQSTASYVDQDTYTMCTLMWHVSEYASAFGMSGTSNVSSRFNNSGSMVELSAPTLNISAYYGPGFRAPSNIAWGIIPYGYYWRDKSGEYPFQKSNRLWSYDQSLYSLEELNRRGTCQQTDAHNIKYQWGFSTVMLIIFAGLMLAWTIGTYAIYLDAYMNSALEYNKRDMGLKRAVLDVNAAMQRDLDAMNVDNVGNTELKKMVKNNRLSYVDLLTVESKTRNQLMAKWWQDFDIKKWLKDEIFWLLFFVFCTIMLILGWTTPRATLWWSRMGAPLIWFGTLLVIVIGRTHKSRWIVFILFFAMFWGWNGLQLKYVSVYL